MTVFSTTHDGVYEVTSLDADEEVMQASIASNFFERPFEELLVINNMDFCDARIESAGTHTGQQLLVADGYDLHVAEIGGVTVLVSADNIGCFLKKSDFNQFVSTKVEE